MPDITPIELDQLQYELENGRPLNRELVAKLYLTHYRVVKGHEVIEEVLNYNLPRF